MDPKPESTKQKLDRYQIALDYVNDVRFAKKAPPESKQQETPSETHYTPGTTIAEINKAITEGDTNSVKEVLKTWLEIDPANSTLTTLLAKSYVSPDEMIAAGESVLSRFAILQDARNNLHLAEERERNLAAQQPPQNEDVDEESADENPENQVQHQEEQQFQDHQPESGQSENSEQSSGHRTPPYVLQRPGLTPEQQEKLNRANRSMQESRNRSQREVTQPQISDRMSQRLNAANRAMRQNAPSQDDLNERRKKAASLLRRPTPTSGFNPLGDWLGKKIAQKIAQSRIGQAVARNFIDPLKQAVANSRAWQAVAPRLQPLINTLDKIASPFRAISNALGAPERWLNSQLGNLANWAGRGLQNLGAQAIRGISNQIGNLFSAARPVAGQIGAGASVVGGGIAYYGGAALAFVTSATFLIVAAIVLLFLWSLWSIFQSQDAACDKPGEMKVQKVFANSGGTEQVRNGQKIDFLIQVTYNWACASKSIENVVVTDVLPQGLIYDQSNPTAESEIGSKGPGPKGVYNETTRTLTWTLPTLASNDPAGFYFSATPNETLNDSWVMNSALVNYTEVSGGAASTEGGFPATQDNCNGTYQLTNPVGNFGDPKCNFKKDDLYNLLKQLDPPNADFWFFKVVRCESGYNPNSWRDPNIEPKTPDPAGAWGLYQMGRGRNGQYDHGDVDWQLQTSNAVTYAQSVPSIASYWACAR